MIKMLIALTLVLSVLTTARAGFYWPGIAPRDYCIPQEDNNQCQSTIDLYVNRLNAGPRSLIPYDYNSFDFCRDPDVSDLLAPENLGQIIFGERIRLSPHKITFGNHGNMSNCNVLCTKTYKPRHNEDKAKLDFLKKTIKLDYQHHWIVDNMPVSWCYQVEYDIKYCSKGFPIGCYVDDKGRKKDACIIDSRFNQYDTYYMFNHLDFTIFYNEDTEDKMARIIRVEVTPHSLKNPCDFTRTMDVNMRDPSALEIPGRHMEDDVSIIYSYSVAFKKSPVKWSSRWNYLLEAGRSNIHWFSLINSIVVVVFLSAILLPVMLRTLRQNVEPNEEKDNKQEEEILLPVKFRWRLVHADIFRPPAMGMLLSVFLGNGVQLFFVAVVTLLFACLGFLSPANRGALELCALISYVCSSPLGGFTCTRLYKMFGGGKPIFNACLNTFLCSGIVVVVSLLLDQLFRIMSSSAAVPLPAMAKVLGIWLGVAVPLSLLGSYLGFRKTVIKNPVHTNEQPRRIPHVPFYKRTTLGIILGGILPFGCIFISLFFILNSIWTNSIYYKFGFLFATYIIVAVTCAESTILLCYFHLCAEDYHWWWRAFLTSGCTAIYLGIYCIYYYFMKLEAKGFASVVIYFGYTLIIVFISFLLTGTIGFFTCFWFIRKIYTPRQNKEIKVECITQDATDVDVHQTKCDQKPEDMTALIPQEQS